MTKIVYLHGFNSAYQPEHEKVVELSRLGEVTGITYDTCSSYQEIFEFLTRNIQYSDDLVIVGTSLGGFWAAQMGRHFKIPSVIINPCRDPFSMMREFVNINLVNYSTGRENVLYSTALDTYKGKELNNDTDQYTYVPLIILDSADEVLSSSQTRTELKDYNIKVFVGGDHRFAHMEEAVPIIQNYINTCNVVQHNNS